MSDFPTRDEARGLLILRGVRVDNNSDAKAIIQAYIDGQLVRVDGPVYAYCNDCDGMFPIHDDYDGHDRKGRYRLVEIGEEQG